MRHRHELLPGAQLAVDDAHVRDDAAIGVELRVEDQAAQMVAGALRRRDARDDRLEDLLDADALLWRCTGSHRCASMIEQLLDLAPHARPVGRRQIDLVDHRDDREVLFERQMVVGQRLRLDALRGVDDQQRALAGRAASATLPRRSRRGPGVSMKFSS